ncbi:TPA: helix-turn-helix domain-containing protein, partial [Klebsiella pneumoniae]
RLVDIAADAGFADQSHMTRQFISRFGLPPGRWLRAIRG